MTDVGISVMPAVLSTRNMIIGLLAVSGFGLISCSSRMAFRPSGVAALSRPSMLALKFITILPLAGYPAGISGKTRRKNGPIARPNNWINPPRSPIFMMPSHRLMTPTSPSEISKPVLAVSNKPFSTRVKISRSPCSNCATAATKPTRMKATQIRLSTGGTAGRLKGSQSSRLTNDCHRNCITPKLPAAAKRRARPRIPPAVTAPAKALPRHPASQQSLSCRPAPWPYNRPSAHPRFPKHA